MADVNLQLSFRITQRQVRAFLMVALLFGVCNELSSESVTLTTYYPAPSGVYTQMITTTNTYLARDSGNVGIGTPSPGAKLDVVGSGAGTLLFRVKDSAATSPVNVYGGMDGVAYPDGTAGIMTVGERSGTGRSITTVGTIAVGATGGSGTSYLMGKVGIGMANPNAGLDVVAPAGSWSFGIRSTAGGGGMRFWQDASNQTYIWNNGQYVLTAGNGNGFVGIYGAITPAAPLDVYGPGGNGYISPRATGCADGYVFGVGAPVYCPGGMYATLVSGLYTHKQAVPWPTDSAGQAVYGTMLCCPLSGPAIF